jgi:eukaryotic-like serine/threonine-protein kinase
MIAMTPELWARLNPLFNAAVGMPSSERDAFIAKECAGDPELRQELAALVEAYAHQSSTLPPEDLSSIARDPLANQNIDGYQTHWKLGSGGNGDVYLATRLTEPHQRVAIKFLRLQDCDNAEFRRRFLRERQIIALLSHPNIVKLFDADQTKDGRPYFVMEYVEGYDLVTFAESKRLTTSERLALFLKVCDAVQYLHIHLIVHRDLKPANILVDHDGHPRILDFGIAKLLRPELMDGELITRTQQHPLTAQYASPEQWEGGPITSTSDVYSLGVILFQLLTGRLPIPWDGGTIHKFREMVCSESRPRASTSVSEGHAALCGEANDEALSRRLAGDLDAILEKSLRRHAIERYATVEALAEDLRRHLRYLPVLARRDSFSYRSRRFLRRNRAWVFSSVAVLAALALGLSVALYQRNTARFERNVAEEQRRQAQLESDRLSRLARDRENVLQELQKEGENKSLEGNQLRAAIASITEEIRRDIKEDEASNGAVRGGDSSPTRYVSRGRSYAVLAQLLALSGDKEGVRQAYQGCTTSLVHAQRAGDDTDSTTRLLLRCQAGARTGTK